MLGLVTVAQTPDLPPPRPVPLEAFDALSRSAVAAAVDALEISPADPDLNARLAKQLLAYDQFELAEAYYQRATALDATSFEWVYLMAHSQIRQGKKEEASRSLKQALGLTPDDLYARVKLGELQYELGQFDAGIETLGNLPRRHFESALVQYALGRSLLAKGQTSEAIRHLTTACRLYPEFGSAHYSLALAHRDTGNRVKATEHMASYRDHQDRWPPNPDPLLASVRSLRLDARQRLALATRLASQDRIVESIREHEAALVLDPSLLQAHVHLIALYGKQGDVEKAGAHYRKSLQGDLTQAESHYNYAVLLSSQGQYAQALEVFRKAVEVNPHYAEAHNSLGAVLQALGRPEEAVLHFRKALENDPTSRRARFNLARAMVGLGEHTAAIAELERILEPEDAMAPSIRYALAAAYVRQGRLSVAFQHTGRARELAEQFGQDELARKINVDLERLRKALER